MWCEHCRQNVTGTLSQTQSSVCCSRCGCALPGEMPAPPLPCPAENQSEANPPATSAVYSPAPPRPTRDQWDIEEDLRHIERLVRRDRVRIDASGWAPSHSEQLTSEPVPAATPGTSGSLFITLRAGAAWLLLCIGLAATVCGLTLLAWHWFGHRADLLIPGLACAAGGQFFLLGGFLIQAARSSGAPASPVPQTPTGTTEVWLDAHRRIDAILRTDLPGPRAAPDRTPGERSSN